MTLTMKRRKREGSVVTRTRGLHITWNTWGQRFHKKKCQAGLSFRSFWPNGYWDLLHVSTYSICEDSAVLRYFLFADIFKSLHLFVPSYLDIPRYVALVDRMLCQYFRAQPLDYSTTGHEQIQESLSADPARRPFERWQEVLGIRVKVMKRYCKEKKKQDVNTCVRCEEDLHHAQKKIEDTRCVENR